MKKYRLFGLMLVAALFGLAACGNSDDAVDELETDDVIEAVEENDLEEQENDTSGRSEFFEGTLEWSIERIDLVLEQLEGDSIMQARMILPVMVDPLAETLATMSDDEIFFPMTEFSLHLDSIIEAIEGRVDDEWLVEVHGVFGERLEEIRADLEALR